MGDTEQHRDNDNDNDNNDNNHDADSAVVPHGRFRKRRRNSDPSSNRPLVSRHRGGPVESDRSSSASDDEGVEEIEVLPDRFDSQGHPVDGSGPSRHQRDGLTERRGDFAYRSPRPGGTQIRGTWGIAGTDPEHVERMVQDISGMLAGEMPRGMGGWLGLAGRLLGGVMAPGALGQAEAEKEEEEEGQGRRDGGYARGGRREDRRDVIGYGGGSEVSRDERGKGRRRIDDHGYNDEEDGEERNEMRRRRRRRRREVD